MTLRLTTSAIKGRGGRSIPGTELEAQSVEYPVTIQAPPNFPTVARAISFGQTEETGERKANLPMEGEGCVWLEGDQVPLTLPEGVRSVRVTSSATSAGSCVSGALPLTLSNIEIGTGLVSGEITVMTRPATDGVEPVPVNVRYELEMQKPRNDAVFWPLFVAISLGGVLIPVLLLYLMKWRTAQIPGNSLLLGSLQGNVGQHSAFLGAGSLTEQAMRGVTLAGSDRRRIPLNSLSEIRTKVGLGLTEPGYGVVEGQPSASSANPAMTRKGRARLPLAVQDRWVALLDPVNPHEGPVEVVFLLAPTSGKLQELLVDARNRLPDVVARLRSSIGQDSGSAGAGTPGPQKNDEWGSSSEPDSSSMAGPARPSGTAGSTTDSSWDEW